MSDSSTEDRPTLAEHEPPTLKFPRRDYSWDFERQAVRFWGRAHGKAIVCRVTLAALRDHFHLDGNGGPLANETFASNRARIEALAVQKWNAGALEPDGSILLRSEEF